MSMEGCLEDLGICDILQILSLSKKTGTLFLSNRTDEGSISFSGGHVIRACSTLHSEGLGQLLVREKALSREQVDNALVYQKKLPKHQPLGKILVDLYHIPGTVVERVVERQIEKIVYSFFSWCEGEFRFHLEELESFGSALVNPLDFMLRRGLSPERLAIKGRKIIDQGVSDVDEACVEQELVALKTRQQQQGIDLLRGMLAELEHPEFCGGIILLILRYASEIMERAIIFDVRGSQLVGVGQFGVQALDDSADDVVRKMEYPLENGSLFQKVVTLQKAIFGAPGQTQSEVALGQTLGCDKDEVFLAPLINDGEVVAILYGDKLKSDRTQRAFEAFEVFLSQAGLAMEQALQR